MEDKPAQDALLSFVEQVSGDEFLKVEEDFGAGFVRLKTSEAERRQAKHDIRAVEDIIVELLRNARDAGAHQIFVATSTEGNVRTMTVIDDGTGVPERLRSLIFEPRVTSKLETMVMDDWGVHGRGMALYSISQNVTSANLISSVEGGGSALKVVIDTDKLHERTDQSRMPICKRVDGHVVVESGPRNVNRHCAEFALGHEHIDVYLGSPAEILSTLYRRGQEAYQSYAEALQAEAESQKERPLWKRPSRCSDAQELMDCAATLGLTVSSRNCYRILNREIGPLPTLVERIDRALAPVQTKADIYKDSRGLKVQQSDIAAFQRDLEVAFDSLAQKYYLSLTDDIKVKVTKDGIRASFPFEKES